MVNIDVAVVSRLIEEQFPEWSHLPIKPVETSGHDNRTFHLGQQLSVRLPSAEAYVPQVAKEQRWLPFLAKQLSLPIPEPVATGAPSDDYPYPWSIYKWLAGETLTSANVLDFSFLAEDLARFLVDLQSINATGAPLAGAHNFYRGGGLAVYDSEYREAVYHSRFSDKHVLQEIWELALASSWQHEPVWVHGDIAPGNLLVNNGKLSAVIDFGMLGAGDPSCDAAIAWTFFDADSRSVFKKELGFDDETWHRARGWALWKALITCRADDKTLAADAHDTVKTIVADYHNNE